MQGPMERASRIRVNASTGPELQCRGHWSGLARIRVNVSNGGFIGAARAPMQGSLERASPNQGERV